MHTLPIWTSDLCVRNPALDAQHIILLEIGRELLRAIECSSNCEEHLLVLLRDIAAVTRRHHVMEEAVLEANGCPTIDSIASAHSAAQAMLERTIADVHHGDADPSVLALQISDWMYVHIHETDMPVREFLRMPGETKHNFGGPRTLEQRVGAG
jgi:hemerythrin-like metal-binding protein